MNLPRMHGGISWFAPIVPNKLEIDERVRPALSNQPVTLRDDGLGQKYVSKSVNTLLSKFISPSYVIGVIILENHI